MSPHKFVQTTNILRTINISRKSRSLLDNVEKHRRAIKATDYNKIRRMRIACWINEATDKHSEYAIFIAFPRQQWLHERP